MSGWVPGNAEDWTAEVSHERAADQAAQMAPVVYVAGGQAETEVDQNDKYDVADRFTVVADEFPVFYDQHALCGDQAEKGSGRADGDGVWRDGKRHGVAGEVRDQVEDQKIQPSVNGFEFGAHDIQGVHIKKVMQKRTVQKNRRDQAPPLPGFDVRTVFRAEQEGQVRLIFVICPDLKQIDDRREPDQRPGHDGLGFLHVNRDDGSGCGLRGSGSGNAFRSIARGGS